MPDATFDRLDACLLACRERAEQQEFNLGIPQQRVAVSLLGSVLEVAEDILSGLRRGRAITPKILLRSLLEAFVQLSNLVKDEAYLKSMHYDQLIAKRKMSNAASQGRRGSENPFFADLLANETTPEVKAQHEAEIAALEAEGVRESTIGERFLLAGEEHRYDSVYRLLSWQTHHNLNALGGRHVAEVEGESVIGFFKPEERARLLAEADQVAGIVADAVALVSGLIDGTPTAMDDIEEALEAFLTSVRGELDAQEG